MSEIVRRLELAKASRLACNRTIVEAGVEHVGRSATKKPGVALGLIRRASDCCLHVGLQAGLLQGDGASTATGDHQTDAKQQEPWNASSCSTEFRDGSRTQRQLGSEASRIVRATRVVDNEVDSIYTWQKAGRDRA